jgi:hypothetical protein
MKGDEVGGARRMHGIDCEYMQQFSRKFLREETT